ncbi:AAA-like domain-containing protein [Kamptonema formosum]|uniref:AAA-like domain-containing protein n=1 Tax=Kamptonema formosum TaxID=331992 RepID=UPI00034D5419|nr:AAA-like domain-containing protein [Oscillatoria sp. PCC 10802]
MSVYKYKIGGSLELNDPTYVVRRADSDLCEGLKAGEFCYVLNSRQMGKSSLRVRTMKNLQAQEGIACTSIDITGIGSQSVTPENWYGGIAFSLLGGFALVGRMNMKAFEAWWCEREVLPPVQRLNLFIEEVLLSSLSHNLIIFIDEIDSIIKIPFKDDFFAFIRACYNKRADTPAYNRLTFCLLGVATPADLIADKQRTPFNIGRAIELTGFTLEEARDSLTPGLAEKADNPERILDEVLQWTGGQPFLTQKLCQLVVEKAKNRKANIDKLAQTHIISNWESQDEPEHLRTIRDRLLRNEQRAGSLLGLYQQIWQREKIAGDGSPEQTELRLSGLVVQKDGHLQVYNRIYQEVFNLDWVERELAKLRPYSEAINAWLSSERKDESRLLRGRALQEALDWAADKNLSGEDYQFLSASQKFALAEAEKANQILESANLEAERLMREAKQATKIERAGVNALREFEAQGGQIKALLAAMEAGQSLQALVQNKSELQEYPATSPLFSLQQILDKIRERNQLTGHQGVVTSVCISPDGRTLATGSNDRTARLWDLSGNQIAEFTGHQGRVWSVCISPDGRTLATGSNDRTARLWDLSGNQIAEFRGHQDWVRSVCISPDGRTLATGSNDGTARLWDLSGKQIAEFTGHHSGVWSVCISPDGRTLATGSNDRTARLWDLSGNQIAEFRGHQDWVRSVCISPDGRTLATGSDDGTARLWDLSGNQIAEFRGHQDWVWSVCISPDGRTLATGSNDGTARLWDLSGNQIAEFRGHQGWVRSVCISPDGRTLATGSSDGTARLWDLSGNQIAEFRGHQGGVTSVCISPDGRTLATGSNDGTARLWDLSGNQIAEFTGHQGRVWSVCISPDGRTLATGSNDRTARLWRVESLDELLARGCEWLKDYLASHPEARKRLRVCG